MRKVIFDLVRNATGMILYPDNIAFFSNTVLNDTDAKIIADYSGTLELAGYAPVFDYGRIISVDAHFSHFTLPQKSMIDLLSIDNPSASDADRLKQATIRQVLKQLDRATEINLDDEEFQEATLAACELLVSAGLIDNAQIKFDELVNFQVAWNDLPDRLKAAYPNH